MCGICGVVNFKEGSVVDRDMLLGMNETLRHRGPDGGDIYLDEHCGLGHRRLSIIDLDSGKQPLANEDQSVWVTFNGEVYNYLELIEDLKKRGHVFRTKSDTEVLVHLYEEKGVDMLADLRGMFAFAIWDANNRRLFIARDRVGKKPLYYAYQPGKHLLFGSEIKALLKSGLVERHINYAALDHYLSFLYVPAPQSIFAEIQKLPAAHYMVVEDGQMQIQKYWDLHYPATGERRSEHYYAERLEDILTEAVKIRLRSDVPLGAFLSGGIDSTAVVSLMARTSEKPIETVSIGFSESEYDELGYARQISQLFGCNYNEFIVHSDIETVLPDLIGYFDEPFADPSLVPTFYVSQATRQKVTVALSGDGGDETLAGYSRHRIEVLEHRLRKMTRHFPTGIFARLYAMLPEGTTGRNLLGDLACAPDEAAARKHYNLLFHHLHKEKLYLNQSMHGDFSRWLRDHYNSCLADNPLDKALYLDIKSYLVDDILVKVDRMSMAVALECRAPLLDHKLLEFLATVPPELKLHGNVTKYLLKRILRKHIPSAILDRKKQGFRLPIEVWLKRELCEYASDLLFSRAFKERGLFDMGYVESMWRDFQKGQRDYAHHFWILLILEIWFQEYIDA